MYRRCTFGHAFALVVSLRTAFVLTGRRLLCAGSLLNVHGQLSLRLLLIDRPGGLVVGRAPRSGVVIIIRMAAPETEPVVRAAQSSVTHILSTRSSGG